MTLPSPESGRDPKPALRALARRQREIAARQAPDAAHFLARQFRTGFPDLSPGLIISAYWPMGAELDVRPLLATLATAGHRLALPVVAGKARPLLFRAWQPGQALRAAPFGVQEPSPEAAELVPDLLLVPLLCFDRQGYRLGYGGGFYDRTLAGLRDPDRGRTCLAVGVGYAAQEVEQVPVGPYDQRLDWIVTEREVIRPGPQQSGVA